MADPTILLVDDSPTDLRLMTSALATRGYRLLTASDGEEALEKAVSQRPRLIFLDVILPKLNGYQVCRQLKASPETRDIRIVLVTSRTQESDRFWGLRQGADEYLTKPFEPEQLQAAAARHV